MPTSDDARADERWARGIDDEDAAETQRAIVGAQLDAYRESLDPANAPPCSTCGGGGRVLIERVEYVSRDMAIDAGDLQMEGMEYCRGEEWVDCPDCPTSGPPEASRADLDDLDLPF